MIPKKLQDLLHPLWRFSREPSGKLYILLALYAALVYLPLIWWGGLIYDDWSVVKLSKDCPGIGTSIQCFWPGYPDRPLASIYYSVLSNLFHAWAAGYFLVAIAAWLTGVAILFRVLKDRFGTGFAVPFFIIAATPSISSTIIFSPAMQGIGAFAFMVWSVSLYLLDRYLKRASRVKYLLSYALMLASLLLYESSLPLFAISAMWPIIVSNEKLSKHFFVRYAKQFILPIFIIMLAVVLYQQLVVTQFFEYISKVRIGKNGANLSDSLLRTVANALMVVTLSVINLCIRAVARLRIYGVGIFLTYMAVVYLIFYALKLKNLPKTKGMKFRNHSLMWATLALVLLGVVFIHFIAQQPPTIVGYNNRGIVGASILVAIAAGLLWRALFAKHRLLYLLGILIFSAYSLSFLLQRENYIEANRIRNNIAASAIPKINSVNQTGMLVLANVPTYTSRNFNNETIFSDEVLDWGNYLRVMTDVKDIRGISLSPGRIERGEVAATENGLHVMTYKSALSLELAWYYDVKAGNLQKINAPDQLQTLLAETEESPAYNYLLPVDARMRDDLRNWLASY